MSGIPRADRAASGRPGHRSARTRAPASCAAARIGPALHPGGQRPGTGNAADPNAARDPALGWGIRHRTPKVSSRLSGHPDLQPEVPEPELEQAPAGQVHDPGQQDDDKDDQDNPDNGNHEAREYKPAYFSHSGNASRSSGRARSSPGARPCPGIGTASLSAMSASAYRCGAWNARSHPGSPGSAASGAFS